MAQRRQRTQRKVTLIKGRLDSGFADRWCIKLEIESLLGYGENTMWLTKRELTSLRKQIDNQK